VRARMSALGHKQPFRTILAQCLLPGVKLTLELLFIGALGVARTWEHDDVVDAPYEGRVYCPLPIAHHHR